MDRRKFLGGAGAVAASMCMHDAWAQPTSAAEAGWRTVETTTRVEIAHPEGLTRLWVPTPLAESTPFQKMLGTKVVCEEGTWRSVEDVQRGLTFVAAEFAPGSKPSMTVTSRVQTRDWAVDLQQRGARHAAEAKALTRWLQPTLYVPVDGIVRTRALEITRGADSDEQKASAIYEWIVANTYRKASVQGCGSGDIRPMLESGDLGGKCADLNALFVGLARAVGLPARDVYGLRVAPSQKGYRSLGPATELVTKAQHCRAEVWLERYGWVPVDPADVRKVILEEAPGGLPMADPRVEAVRQRLFGSWEMNWIALNYAQDVALPGSKGLPLHFFMYPQAETADGRLDCLDPDSFRYSITARELVTERG